MILRDEIEAIFLKYENLHGFDRRDAIDAIVARVRAHLTSDEAVERGLDAAHKLPNVYGATGKIRAAILAALGDQP